MRERLDGDKVSLFSLQPDSLEGLEIVKKEVKRKPVNDPFYQQFENEEDYLLTHLSEYIYHSKMKSAELAALAEAEETTVVEVNAADEKPIVTEAWGVES